MSRNWHRKMLLSYFPIFILTLSIVIFLSFLVVNEISRSETQKANRISTGFIEGSLEKAMRQVEMDVLRTMENDALFGDFMAGRIGRSNEDVYDLVKGLKALESGNELIDSIYLYRESDQLVLSKYGLGRTPFADRAFLALALDHPDYRGWSALRSYKLIGADKPRQVITMYKRLPLPFGHEGMVVINVDAYAVSRLIADMASGEVSFLHVQDADGNLLFPYQVKDRGSLLQDGDVLTTLHSERLGWTLESGLRTGQLFAWVSVISYVWILIGAAAVSFAVWYILYVTRKNYRPIQVMMSRIQALPRGMDSTGRDELALIDHALERLIEQSTDYERSNHENLLVRRRQLFIDIIEGDVQADTWMRCVELGTLVHSSETVHAAVVISEFSPQELAGKGYSAEEQQTMRLALMNLLQELAREHGLDGWAEWVTGGRLGVIVTSTDEDGMFERLRDAVRSANRWTAEHFDMTMLFGVGVIVRFASGLAESYRSAVAAMHYRLALGEEEMVLATRVPAQPERDVYYFFPMMTGAVKMFRAANPAWRDQVMQLFKRMERDLLADQEIHMLIHWLIQMLGKELAGVSEQFNPYFQGAGKEAWSERIRQAGQLWDMHTLLLELMNENYRVFVSINENKSYRAMVSEMKAYIEENFTNPDLSLTLLSERFQVSAKYASQLFKEEFETKFVDFLADLRVLHAKKLLVQSDAAIAGIAVQVGYTNVITFGRVFKRVTGHTPGDFRRAGLLPDR